MSIAEIRRWMRRNLSAHLDPKTGEVNCTSLVEAWDQAVGTGDETLDPEHPAWDVAVEIVQP